MKYVNDLKDFSWATTPNDWYAKICVNRESFWIRDCETVSENRFKGRVDNYPLFSDEHGLYVHDEIEFSPTL